MSKNWRPKEYQAVPKRALLAWEPSIIQEGSSYFIKINPGAVNGFIPVNWQEKFSLSQDLMYVKLKVMSNSGNISAVTLEVSSSKDDTEQKANKTTPPAQFKILLGVFFKGEYYMMYRDSLFIAPTVLYVAQKDNFDFGSEPYDKFYVWQVIT